MGGSGGSLGLKQPQVPVQPHHLLVIGHARGCLPPLMAPRSTEWRRAINVLSCFSTGDCPGDGPPESHAVSPGEMPLSPLLLKPRLFQSGEEDGAEVQDFPKLVCARRNR